MRFAVYYFVPITQSYNKNGCVNKHHAFWPDRASILYWPQTL